MTTVMTIMPWILITADDSYDDERDADDATTTATTTSCPLDLNAVAVEDVALARQ